MTLKDLPSISKREKTYLEILKVHNREVPMANLLRFLFDPKCEHGLGDLFIKSLFETESYDLDGDGNSEMLCKKGYKLDGDFKLGLNCHSFEINTQVIKAEVNTEEGTLGNKRIDLVIRSTDFIIVIEFKLNHVLNNPLDVYKKHFETAAHRGKKLFFVVLTPFRKKIEDSGNNKILEFRQIVLTHFIKKVKTNKRNVLNDNEVTNSYSYIYNDFISTIENRTRQREIRNSISKIGYINIKETLLEDLSGDVARQWEKEFQALDKQMFSKIKALKKDLGMGAIVSLKNTAFNYFLKITVGSEFIKIRLTLEGWTIELWGINGDGKEKLCDKSKFEIISFDTNITNIASKVLKFKNSGDFKELFGAWEDDRNSNEIIREIKAN